MSKAFTREDDDTEHIRLDDLPQSPHPNFVTATGLATLHERLSARQAELTKLRAAPEDLVTKLAIATAERDIRFLEGRISRAILIDTRQQPRDVVAFGAEVDVVDEDDTRRTFRIVGEDEADPARGLITRLSPLGVALIGATLHSTVEWKKPTGSVELEVVAIRYL